MSDLTPHRAWFELDVADVLGASLPTRMRGWAMTPHRSHVATPIVYALAGGLCRTDYFDLQVDGDPTYSMAAHFVRHGIGVIAVDHPGIGASDPIDDLFTLTPSVVVAAHERIHRHVARALAEGTLAEGIPPLNSAHHIGLGHSMGAMLTDVLQSRHRPFSAIIGLGHTGSGYPHLLTDDERAAVDERGSFDEANVERLARTRFASQNERATGRSKLARNAFFQPDVPQTVRDAFRAQQTMLLYTCGLVSMLPNSTGADKANIDVPVFLAFGDHDQADPRDGSVQRYRGTPDLTFYVLPNSAHCHNQASTRVLLWDRIIRWIRSLDDVSATSRM